MQAPKNDAQRLRKDLLDLVGRVEDLIAAAPAPMHELTDTELTESWTDMLANPSVWTYWRSETKKSEDLFQKTS